MVIFNKRYYKGTAAVEFPTSGLLTKFKLRSLEKNVLQNTKPAPSTWMRYVVDIVAVWNHGLSDLRIFSKRSLKLAVTYNSPWNLNITMLSPIPRCTIYKGRS